MEARDRLDLLVCLDLFPLPEVLDNQKPVEYLEALESLEGVPSIINVLVNNEGTALGCGLIAESHLPDRAVTAEEIVELISLHVVG